MAITCNGIAAGGIPLLTDITNSTFAINETLTFSATAGDVITSSSISFQDPADLDGQLNITFGNEGGTGPITVTGNWDDPFSDQFTYVEQGQSDKTQTPTVVQSVGNMPSGKIMYDLNQDNTEYVTKGLFLTVVYEDTNGVAQPNAQFYPEVKLYNPWERIRSFISNYYT
jgi:hypothetical protein|tara:strand:+ start:146 stop:655 length:510 start_codon:yes stop_codon:yes gene_type:complete